MKNILSPLTITKIDINIFNEFLSLFENEDKLFEEIDNLKNYFNIESDTSIIERFLKYKLKYFKLDKTISCFIEIITQFNFSQSDFFFKIKQLKSDILLLENTGNIFEENIKN